MPIANARAGSPAPCPVQYCRVQGPYRSFKEIGDLQPKSEEQELIARGFRVYNKPSCVACHQSDGNGSASLNAPPLARSEWVLEKDPNRLIRIVLHGLSGPIKVLDKEWGAGAMLGWKDLLTDQEIADVLTYIRNSWGNKAPPVKADQVKRIREETKDHAEGGPGVRGDPRHGVRRIAGA